MKAKIAAVAIVSVFASATYALNAWACMSRPVALKIRGYDLFAGYQTTAGANLLSFKDKASGEVFTYSYDEKKKKWCADSACKQATTHVGKSNVEVSFSGSDMTVRTIVGMAPVELKVERKEVKKAGDDGLMHPYVVTKFSPAAPNPYKTLTIEERIYGPRESQPRGGDMKDYSVDLEKDAYKRVGCGVPKPDKSTGSEINHSADHESHGASNVLE